MNPLLKLIDHIVFIYVVFTDDAVLVIVEYLVFITILVEVLAFTMTPSLRRIAMICC